MLNASIWYRHWLEIRMGLLLVGVLIALLCVLYPVVLFGSSGWFAQSGKISKELSIFSERLPAMGPERFFPWGAHAWISAAAALFVYIPLLGTGIRTSSLQPGHASLYYTLTLPISRFALIWTRFATACASVFLLFLAMLVFNCAVLLVLGRAVPLGAMAASSFFAAILVVPALAFFSLLTLWNEGSASLAITAAILLELRWAWTPTTSFLATPGMPWDVIGMLLLLVTATLGVAAVLARRKDF